jgi:NH3-dependent NAD+ synthetase
MGMGHRKSDVACLNGKRATRAYSLPLKTEVRRLGRHLGVPDKILRKKPSTDGWPEQTDEGELGAAYEDIEEILDALGYPMFNVRSGRQEPANHGLMNKVQSRRPIIIFFSLSNSWYFF